VRQLVLKCLELFAEVDRYWSRAAQRARSERQPRQVGGAPPLCLSQGLAAVQALCLLLPLPWTKTTIPRGFSGTAR